jgi:hypothetical protein
MKENLVALEIRFKGLQLVFQVMAKQAKKKKKPPSRTPQGMEVICLKTDIATRNSSLGAITSRSLAEKFLFACPKKFPPGYPSVGEGR